MEQQLDPTKLPAHLRAVWLEWKQEEKSIQQKHKLQLRDYEKRQKEAKDAQRDKDFKDAIDKVSRAGYTGKHGTFVVPQEDFIRMHAWRKQATLGDFDENKQSTFKPDQQKVIEVWTGLQGVDTIQAKRKYISLANELITEYGWNPPEGWR